MLFFLRKSWYTVVKSEDERRAKQMKSVFMEELSWQDIKTAMEQGVDTVLICAASHEQHGPHLAESTDYIIGKALCEAVAKRMGNVLVAPLIRPGLSVHHMNHPGSLTLRPEVFRGLVEDYVSCYVRHGFKNIVLYSSHGGNFATLHAVAEELRTRYPEHNIVSPFSLTEFTDVCAKGEQIYGYEEGVCGGHACCFETSIVLYARPDCVDMSKAVPGLVSGDRDQVAEDLFAKGMTQISPCGILGDPRDADAEKGKVFLEMLTDAVCDAIASALKA